MATSTEIGGLTDGTLYTFQVSATNGLGTGSVGTSNGAVPTPPAPLLIRPGTTYSSGGVAKHVQVADANHDGRTDVLTANSADGTLSYLGGAGNGTLGQPATVSTAGITVKDTAFGDFNGDGKLDAAVVNGSATVGVMLGSGDGSFGSVTNIQTLPNGNAGSPTVTMVAVADMNGDGKPDIIVAGSNGSVGVAYWDDVWVLLGNGDGTFQTPVGYGVQDGGGNPEGTGLIVTDLNGDGRPDVVFVWRNAGGGNDGGFVRVFVNNGDGTFNQGGVLVSSGYGYGAAQIGEGGVVADINGDGIPDIVVPVAPQVPESYRGISVSLGNGDGTFLAPPLYVADPALTNGVHGAGTPGGIVAVDMNGDGIPDIVTADNGSVSGPSGVSVYLVGPNGTITSPTFIATPSFGPKSLAAADLNGDGATDLIAGNDSGPTGNVLVLLNGTDFPPLGGPLQPGEIHGCIMCQALAGGGALQLAADPVTLNSGEWSETVTDLAISARGYPLAISQTYNDLGAATDAGLGYGWWSSIFVSLTQNASTGITTVTQEGGGQAQFWTSTLQPVGPRTQATLVHNGDSTWTFTRYKGDTFTFSSTGQITKKANLTGDTLTYGYTAGQVTSLTHSDGRSLGIAWTGSHVTTLTDANVSGSTRTVGFTYDGSNQLTDIDWKLNGGSDTNEHFEYETTPWNHGLTGMRDPRGFWVTQTYDSSGHTTSQTVDPTAKNASGLNRVTTFAYTLTNGAITQTLTTDPKLNQEQDTYAYGERIQRVLGYGTVNAATWNYAFAPSSIGTQLTLDPNGNGTTATYDSYGNVLTATDALGRTGSFSYTGNGGADAQFNQPTTATDPKGVTTTFSYDPTHRTLTQTSTPLVGSGTTQIIQYQHTTALHPGDVTAMIDGDGKTWTYAYDAYGNPSGTTDPLGNTSTAVFNADGWMTASYSPKGAGTGSPSQPASGGIAGGTGFSLALGGDGNTWAWGYNAFGSVGNGTTVSPVTTPGKVCAAGQTAPCSAFLSGVATLAAGQKFGIAAKSDGTVWDWGYNGQGQLGTGNTTNSSVPVQAGGLTGVTVTAVAAGLGNSVALSSAGHVYSWGLNSSGELGDGTTTTRKSAVEVCAPGQTAPCSSFLSGITAIATHKRSVVALKSDGTVYTWGANDKGQLGNGLAANASVPVQVCAVGQTAPCSAFLTGVTAVAAGQSSVVVRKSDGTVNTWGLNDVGELANGTTDSLSHPIPTVVAGLSNITAVSEGKGHVLALASDGTLRSWGGNTNGQLGIGSAGGGACSCKATVQTVSGLSNVTSMAAGEASSLAITSDGKTWSWGGNANGELGNGTSGSTNVLTPTQFTGIAGGGLNPAYETQYAYNQFGHRTTTTDPLGHVTTAHYDADQNVDTFTDANSNLTTYVYNDADQRVQTKRADTPQTTLTTDYNADGTVADQKDGKTNTIQSYGYDSLARVTTVTDALSHVTTYTYDGAGNPLTVQDPGGTCPSSGCTTTTYDAAHEVTGVTYSDGVTPNVTNLVYDADGQRTGVTDGTGSSTYVWDSLHRVTSVTNGNGAQVQSAYNLRNLPITLTYPGTTGAVTQGYDDAGRLSSVQDWNGQKTTFGYDANSNLLTETLPTGTGVVDTNTFNAADVLTGISDVHGGTTVFAATYGRDNANQVSSDTSVPAAVGQYKYTALNQLCYGGSANSTACSSPPANSFAYTLDAADNLRQTQNATHTGAVTQSFNAADQLCWTVAGASSNACASPPAGATTFGFDTRGNRTSAVTSANAGTCDAYDQARRLTSISTGTGSSCSTATTVGTYAYNAGGTRMSKTVGANTTQFAWAGSALLQEKTGANTTSYIYGPGGMPLELITPTGTTYYYQHDQLGSTRALVDATGTVQATDTYDPYGNLTASTGSVTNPLLYAGQYVDAESGLYYLRARYYDPATAQFLTVDPLVALTRSPYAYVGGNPVNGTDPSGLCPWGVPDSVCNAASTVVNTVGAVKDNAEAGARKAIDAVCDGAGSVTSCVSNNVADFSRGNAYVRATGGPAVAAFCVIPGTQLACLASDADLAASGRGSWLTVAADVPSVVLPGFARAGSMLLAGSGRYAAAARAWNFSRWWAPGVSSLFKLPDSGNHYGTIQTLAAGSEC